MNQLFNKEKILILDASVFHHAFNPDEKNSLKTVKIYTAGTFSAAVKELSAVLPGQLQTFYQNNIQFLIQETDISYAENLLLQKEFSDRIQDTWELIQFYHSLGASFTVLTGNQLLIQRLIVNRINADIYDFLNRTILHHYDFWSMSSKIDSLKGTDGEMLPILGTPSTGQQLFLKNGTSIQLGQELRNGMESRIFLLQDRDTMIAKIFKDGQISKNKYDHLYNILGTNEKTGIFWALFPIELLYFDRECRHFAGITEKYESDGQDLIHNPLFLGDLSQLTEQSLSASLSSTVELCLKLVRQVVFLNHYGFLVSDFNLANFSIIPRHNETIQMWDTDSFGYDSFFSGFFAGGVLTRDYDTSTKEGAIMFCNEVLYASVFSLLTLGDMPLSERNRSFKYDRQNYYASDRRYLMPDELFQHFASVFRREKNASVEALLTELSLTLEYLRSYPSEDPPYKKVIDGETIIPTTFTHCKEFRDSSFMPGLKSSEAASNDDQSSVRYNTETDFINSKNSINTSESINARILNNTASEPYPREYINTTAGIGLSELNNNAGEMNSSAARKNHLKKTAADNDDAALKNIIFIFVFTLSMIGLMLFIVFLLYW